MKIKEIYIRWVGILIVARLAMLSNKDHMAEDPLWFQYFISFCFTAIYWNGAYLIICYLRGKFPGIKHTGSRLLLTGLGVVFWMTFGGLPLKLVLGLTTLRDVLTLSDYAEFLVFNLIAASIISIGYEATYFFAKWKEAFRISEELRNRQLRTQFEVLQNQMSPHFLFNCLNTLTTIIPEDPKSAVRFTERLSDVYRYILHNKEKDLVSMESELEFVKSFLYLLEIRYPENLKVSFDIPKKLHGAMIAPMTMQILVENAIKHNIISKSKPLHVRVTVDSEENLVVWNNLQKREVLAKSTKTGIQNIEKRYELLGKPDIQIIKKMDYFEVKVPLIHVSEEREIRVA